MHETHLHCTTVEQRQPIYALEIDALRDDIAGTGFDLLIDLAQVLTEDTDTKKLHPSQEIHW